MKTRSDPRHQSRIIALQKLFELEFHATAPFPIEDIRSINEAEDTPIQIDESFILALVNGIQQNAEEIDTIIKQYTKKRPFEDTAKIDLLILRIAIFEMLFSGQKTPVKVVIDEAVELAKEFGGEKSSNFINGVLGNISHIALTQNA